MKKTDKFFLIIFLLLQTNFFDLINIRNSFLNGFASYSQKKLLLLIILIYIIVKFFGGNRFSKDISGLSYNKSFFSIFVYTLFFSWVIVYYGTVAHYGQSLLSTFFNSYYFFILLLYFVYSYLLNSWEKWVDFIKIVLWFSTILSLTKILQSFVLSKFNYIIFYLNTNNDYNTATQLKFMTLGFTRIPSATDFVFFSILLMFVILGSGKKILPSSAVAILFFIQFFYLFAVGQTRSYLLLTVLLVIVYCAIKVFRKFGNGGGLAIGLILSTPVTFLFLSFLNQLLVGNSSRSVALTIRQDAIQYYIQNLRYNGIFSFGFLRDDLYGQLIHGVGINGMSLGFNYDDVGIFGFLAIFGLIGVFIMFIYSLSLMLAFTYSRNKFITFMIYVYIFGSWTSLSLFDPQRIFYLPVLLALLDFLTNENVINLEGREKNEKI